VALPSASWYDRAERAQAVKLIAEYLDHAMQFERMAGDSQDPKLREQLLQQCAAYRKLATRRAMQLGATPPDSKPSPKPPG
jgi:hypothetical protein